MRRWSAALGVVLLGVVGACGRPHPPSSAPPPSRAARDAGDKVLLGAFSVLDRWEDFDESRGTELVFERLTQWRKQSARRDADSWRPDPLVDTLPDDLRTAANAPKLDAPVFTAPDDVVWLRDERWLAFIAQRARDGEVRDIEVARNLFRWTVRSLAIVADPPLVTAADTKAVRWWLPGEILLGGRASAAQRAWIFLALVRHAGLDGAMLATPGPSGTLRPWIPAVVCDGEAYLFEPTYGMPVPGPGDDSVATVRQAAADPAILAALSTPERTYPVQADDLAGLGVLVAADPWSLSRRMADLERAVKRLPDRRRDMQLVLDASRTGKAVAAALPAGERADVRLWDFPWTTLARRRADPQPVFAALQRDLAPLGAGVPGSPRDDRRLSRPLFAARVREFRPDDVEAAMAAYLAARPSRDAVADVVKPLPPPAAEAARAILAQMREDATYWLGVLMLAEGKYEAAIDYLERMTLEATPDSRWADAARQNLGRAYAALERDAEAAAILRQDESPQRFGSRLAADRLERRRRDTAP